MTGNTFVSEFLQKETLQYSNLQLQLTIQQYNLQHQI